MTTFCALALSLVLSLLFTRIWRGGATRWGVMDHPVSRSSHTEPVATCGGFAIFGAFWLTTLALQWPPSQLTIGILLGSVILVGVCFWDDTRGLPALPRLAAQMGVAVLTYAWGLRVVGVTNPLSAFVGPEYLSLGYWSGPVTVLWLVFVVNAVNWLDGIDGLAAGVSSIAAITLAAVAISGNRADIAIAAAALAGSALGFLRHNFSPARVFMGDVGAMFLGYILACLAVGGAVKGPTALVLVVPVLVLGLPIYDSATTILARLWARRPIYYPDRGHLHHRLMDKGLSVRETVLLMYGITGLLCMMALGAWLR